MRCIFNNRTTGMTSFSIGTNPTTGTNWTIGHVCLLVDKNRLKYKHVMRIVRSISKLYKTSSLLLQVETR